MLRVTSGIVSWLGSAIALTNASLVARDGCRETLAPWTRGATLTVASLFVWIGVTVLGAELNLGKLRRFTIPESQEADWHRVWRRLHLFWIAGMLFLLPVMLAGLMGIHSRFMHRGR